MYQRLSCNYHLLCLSQYCHIVVKSIFILFYHLRSEGAIESAVLFCCFRDGVLCLLHVSPYIAGPGLDFSFFSKYFSGCFLYNSLDVVGEDVYAFFEQIESCEFAAYSSLKNLSNFWVLQLLKSNTLAFLVMHLLSFEFQCC